jgi:hypothetical protein
LACCRGFAAEDTLHSWTQIFLKAPCASAAVLPPRAGAVLSCTACTRVDTVREWDVWAYFSWRGPAGDGMCVRGTGVLSMSGPISASGAQRPTEGAKRFSPAAQRNTAPILAVIHVRKCAFKSEAGLKQPSGVNLLHCRSRNTQPHNP